MSTTAAVAVALAAFVLWVVSIPTRDVSIIDILWGPAYGIVAWASLATVFGLQAALVCVISLPVQAALGTDAAPMPIAYGLGVVAWAVGLYFEAVGDLQLARFKADPENRGRVLDTGLWPYTRHPNDFGDFMVWWGLVGSGGVWSVAGLKRERFSSRRPLSPPSAATRGAGRRS